MKKYKITKEDMLLIDVALDVLKENFDDYVYHHTVGCAVRCMNENGNLIKVKIVDLLPYAWEKVNV